MEIARIAPEALQEGPATELLHIVLGVPAADWIRGDIGALGHGGPAAEQVSPIRY